MPFRHILPDRDPRTVGWFGAGDWATFGCLIGTYVFAVSRLLPRYMSTRPKFQILSIIRLYNLVLIITNIYFGYHLAVHTYLGGGYSWLCQGLGQESGDIFVVQLLYYYMFVRIFEFLDTVFFVLRKKFEHASVLNISHHCIAVLLPWYGVAYGIDGQTCLMSLVNMGVHVIMYTYYLLASFPSLRSYLTWKRYLTLLQIGQFVVIIGHMSVPAVYDCGYPILNSVLVITAYIYFLMMFRVFYDTTYQTGFSGPVSREPSCTDIGKDDLKVS